jgi:hypothetical protein
VPSSAVLAQAQKKAARFLGPPFPKSKCKGRLEPAATAITTVSTATITTATAATFTAAAATTATVSTATTTTTAAFALFHRTRFIHGQGPAVDFLAMEFRDRRLRLFRRAHFDKAETTGATGHAVIDHLHPSDIARLGKQIGQVVFCHAKGQIAHIEFNAHLFFSLVAR